MTRRIGMTYEPLNCPICGKVLGEIAVEGRVIFKKDRCPRCKKVVTIEKGGRNRGSEKTA
jgi:phage FluMu protein Com